MAMVTSLCPLCALLGRRATMFVLSMLKVRAVARRSMRSHHVQWPCLCVAAVMLAFVLRTPRHFAFLAHLSQRLIGELIGYSWSGVRPSVVVRRSQCSKIFFSETALPIKSKFYVEPPWVGGTIFCSLHLGHMTKMAATPIYGKNPLKNLLLQKRGPIFKKLGM